jgi:hypothetical protein
LGWNDPTESGSRFIFSGLTPHVNADMMSDMKTFTVRDLDRRPNQVLEACDSFGEARIRCRDGRTYVIKTEEKEALSMSALPDFAARRRELFGKSASRSFARRFDQALASE